MIISEYRNNIKKNKLKKKLIWLFKNCQKFHKSITIKFV